MRRGLVLKWLGRTVEIISVSKLKIDPKYQRGRDKGNLERIRNPLDEGALRSIVVSLRADGFYYVLDGQHRSEVMLGLGYKEVLAEVHRGLSRAREAALFVALNNTKHVTPTYKFRANLTAGNKPEREIASLVAAHGMVIKSGAGRPRVGESVITVLGTLQWIYSTLGKDILDEALQVISEGFRNEDGTVQRAAMNRDFVKGVAKYVHQSGKNASDILPFIVGYKAADPYQFAREQAKSYRSDADVEIVNWFQKTVERRRSKAA